MNMQRFYSFITTICLVLLTIPFYAQITNVWIGGSPGHETEWNFHKNWSKNQVPDWSSDVIIPNNYSDHKFYPVVADVDLEVNSLNIHSGAELTIAEDAFLSILNDEYRLEAFKNRGKIRILGNLEIEGEIFEDALVFKK